MRTYDDAFSGQKIYPGKVRLLHPWKFCAGRISRGEDESVRNSTAFNDFTTSDRITYTLVFLEPLFHDRQLPVIRCAQNDLHFTI